MSAWETTYGLLVIQVTLLSAMAAGAYLVIARRHPATAKMVLGVTAILLLGLTAVAGMPLPHSWSLDIWPERAVAVKPAEPAPDGRNKVDLGVLAGTPDESWGGFADPVSVPAEPLNTSSPPPSPPITSQTTAVFRSTLVLELLLLAGGLVAGIRLIRGLWLTHRVLRRSRKINDLALVRLADEVRHSIGCQPVELRVSTEIASAATVGWRRPVLIISDDWQQWSEQELKAVLAHEMMHVRSNDYLTGLVARVTMVLYFYHPLVRWLGTRFFLAQEAVADAAAARSIGGRANYLAVLSRIALRQDRGITSLPFLAFATSFNTFLMRRIEMLETKDGRHVRGMRFVHWTTLGCLCLGAIAVSALRAPAQDGKTESEAAVRVARKEARKSIDEVADSTAQGASARSEELPPLPWSVTHKITTEYDGRPTQTIKMMKLGTDRSCQEALGEVIGVSNQGTSLLLNSRDKKATIIEYPKNDDEQLGLFGFYRKLLTDPRYRPEVKREVLGESEIDGRRVVGHRITSDRSITKIWVDPQSLLPVQIEHTYSIFPNQKTIETDFVFNVDLNESLFSVEPPAGYTVYRRQMKERRPYEEKDLIETFRLYREEGQSTFPDALDADSYRDLARKKSRALPEEPTPAQNEQYWEWSEKVSRGPSFAHGLPPEADAHYAGKSVKTDATDTPIFWYIKVGTGRYRVILADLSVIDTDTPPEIPDAKAINDWKHDERSSRRPWRNPAAEYNVQNLAPLVREMGNRALLAPQRAQDSSSSRQRGGKVRPPHRRPDYRTDWHKR